MEDRVDVYLKDQAIIPCLYTLKEPAMMIVWFTKLPGKDQSRIRIYYYDNQTEIIDEGSNYAGRIQVSHSHDAQSGVGSAVLTIDTVELSDQREFICMVHNVSEDGGEGHTRLQVFNSPSLPVIELLTHTGIYVTEEEPSKVAKCKVDDGYPRPNITWYKDRFPLQPSVGEIDIKETVTVKTSGLVAVESQLFMKVIREDEDAIFYCEVQYFVPGASKMSESNEINITVFYPTTEVTLSMNTPERLIKEGDTVEIQCEGNGKPQPIFTFTFKQEEKEVEENGILILGNVTRSNSGTYECRSLDFDTGSEFEDSINITVHYLDHIVVTPEETVLDQMQDLTLTCNALSSLPTYTTWYKDGWSKVEEGHVLELHNASHPKTSGKYTCEVMVPSLPELREQKSVQISVRGKPKIEVTSTNNADHSVNLTCYAQGYPIPNITWTISDRWTGKPVPVLNVETQSTDTGVFSMISVKATSALTATCRADNEIGTDNDSLRIDAIARVTTTTQAISPKATGFTNTPKQPQRGGSGVAIAVIIICLLLIAILGSVLYFLYKKGRLPCGRSGKQDFTKEKASKDDIVMEMKSGKSEEAVLLQGVNGDKKSPTE
ncbi:hypothetical protein PO909_003194 [Leuciscus waleckii]